MNALLRGYDRLTGSSWSSLRQPCASRVQVRQEICQPMGLVHGGVYASLAESMASLATALAVMPEGDVALGLTNNTSFLRPITEGAVHAIATRVHRGRTTWIWDVTFSDDAGRTCALTRMTIAVRPMRGEQAPALSGHESATS